MKSRIALYVLAPVLALALSSCASESQIKAAIEKNPDILFNAIEKNPEKFMDTVQKAAQLAQRKGQEEQEREEKARVENELKNPLTPELAPDRAYKGPANAPVTVVEYSDFQCPYCERGFRVVQQILKAYPGKVRFLFKNLPLPMHPLAMPAHQRYEAIALQDSAKAYKFHDEVFANQAKLNSGGEKWLDSVAAKVGADVGRMKKDMDGDKVKARIEADMAEAEKYGISGTPGFVVSGVSVRGAYPFETFKEIIDKKLASSK